MKVFPKVLLFVLLVLATFSVSHGDEFVDEDVGWYYGVSVFGASIELEDDLFDFGDADTDSDATAGVGAKWGLRLDTASNEVDFALELNFTWYDSFDRSYSIGGDISETDVWSVTLRPKLYISGIGNGRFAPYVYAGVGVMSADEEFTGGIRMGTKSSDVEFVAELGAGLEVALTKHVGVFTDLGYVRPYGALEDLSHVTLGTGIVFRF